MGRKKNGSCKSCNKEIASIHTYCRECRDKISREKSIHNKTLLEINLVKGSNKYSHIRQMARKIAKDIDDVCYNCGYDKHVEVCHIKSISSFSKDTYVREINSIHNLIKLCKNCHWEFDNGLLEVGVGTQGGLINLSAPD